MVKFKWLSPQERHPPKWAARANRKRRRLVVPSPVRYEENGLVIFPEPWTHWVCNRCELLIPRDTPETMPCKICGYRGKKARYTEMERHGQ